MSVRVDRPCVEHRIRGYGCGMQQVWIVYHGSSPDNTILGVFDDEAEAYVFQEEQAPNFPKGVLLTPFSVPWRCTDGSTVLSIG